MKIAILNLYSGINHRGAEVFTSELANKLSKTHRLVFFQVGNKTREQKVEVNQIKVKVSQPDSKFPKNLIKKIRKYLFLDPQNLSVLNFTIKTLPKLRKAKPDIVLALNGFWQLLLLKLLQPFMGFKIVVAGHSGPGWDDRWNLYLNPNAFIAITKPAFHWAKRVSFWTDVHLIPLAIDKEDFKRAKPALLDLPKPIILCPSALVPYKRLELAIKAAAKIKNVSLLILGKGNLEELILNLGNKLLKERFRLTSVSHEEMASYYKACDLVTLPSAPQENAPVVFMESLAAGKLVVTTNTSRNRWLLEEAGIYCNPVDTLSYSKALREGLNKKREEKSENTINKALKKFEWQKVLNQYNNLLHSLKN